MKLRKLTKKELTKAIDFMIKYDADSATNDGTSGIYNLLRYGCPAYNDFKQKDIEMFLENNEDLTIEDLIN